MIEKTRQAAAFLSWYRQISLPKVRFALTLHAWTKFFFFLCSMFLLIFCFCFQKKKKKKRGESCRYLFLYLAFQISYVFLADVSVPGALIIFAFI